MLEHKTDKYSESTEYSDIYTQPTDPMSGFTQRHSSGSDIHVDIFNNISFVQFQPPSQPQAHGPGPHPLAAPASPRSEALHPRPEQSTAPAPPRLLTREDALRISGGSAQPVEDSHYHRTSYPKVLDTNQTIPDVNHANGQAKQFIQGHGA